MPFALPGMCRLTAMDTPPRPREWGAMESQQQQRGQDAMHSLTSISLQLLLPGYRISKGELFGAFQHTQAAVFQVTLPPFA